MLRVCEQGRTRRCGRGRWTWCGTGRTWATSSFTSQEPSPPRRTHNDDRVEYVSWIFGSHPSRIDLKSGVGKFALLFFTIKVIISPMESLCDFYVELIIKKSFIISKTLLTGSYYT
jgi:hypothetical protein